MWLSFKESEREKGVEVINCGSYISVADINGVLHAKPHLCQISKNLLRRAANLVAQTDDYILRDCEVVLVNGNDLHIIFHAGNGGNRYVLNVVSTFDDLKILLSDKNLF